MSPTPPSGLPPLPPAFTTAEARTAGVPPQRLRRADLSTPLHGVRVRAESPGPSWADVGLAEPGHGWSGAVLAALLRRRGAAVLSHDTAAHLHGMPTPHATAPSSLVHVTLPPGQRLRREGVAPHRRDLPAHHVGAVHGLRATTPERTWADLCTRGAPWTPEDLIAAGDHLLARRWSRRGRREPASTPEGLAAVVEALGGVPGIDAARRALAQVRVGSDSPLETRVRLDLIAAGLGEPILQFRLDAADPQCPEVDLYYADGAVALEYDGAHHLAREQQARDARRDRWLLARGVAPLRVTAEDHREACRRLVEVILERRAAGHRIDPRPESTSQSGHDAPPAES